MDAMTKQTTLLQQLLTQMETKPAKQQQNCFKCEGFHLQKNLQKGIKLQSGLKLIQTGNDGSLAQA